MCDQQLRGNGRGDRGRGRGRGDPQDQQLPSTSASTSGQGRGGVRGRVRGRGRGQDHPDLIHARAEAALFKRRMNAMPAGVRKEFIDRMRKAQLQVLLPDAPPRKRKARLSPEREPETEPEPEPESATALEPEPIPDMDLEADMDVILVGNEVEVETASADPMTSKTARRSMNAEFVATAEDWMLADDSDEDLDIDFDFDQDACVTLRNAASEPASFIDMTELQTQIVRTEDEANDRALRELIQDEDCYRFDWSRDKVVFTGRRETFTGTSGPTFDVTDMTPVDLFDKFFDKDFIDRLCDQTNRYAEQKIALLRSKNVPLNTSRLHRWTETNADEMITFLAILILMGLYPMPEEEKYFSFNGFGTMPYFSRIMPYNRFLLLKSMYHFVDETMTDRTKLAIIQPVIDYLNDKFSTMYMPCQEIAIDESLLKWHGRLSFAQKIATKAAQVGVKSFELCESRTGYLWKFKVYEGKKTNDGTNDATNDETNDAANDAANDDTNDATNDATNETDNATNERPADETAGRPTNTTAKIVFDLVEPLLHRGHTLIMDNFYNSPLLLRSLKKNQTDCYGTIRLNREFVPDSIKTMTKTDLRHGEVVATYCSDLSLMVWRDSILVAMISTYHQLEIGNQNKYNRLTYKPKLVLDYNKSMGGVDRKDQFLSAHPVERLRNKVWYKKVFARLLSTSVFNIFIIYQTKHPKVSHRHFRTILAEGLVRRHAQIDLTTEPRLYTNRKTGQLTRHTNSRPTVDHDHFPVRSSAKRPRCWMCTRQKKDTRTTWMCSQCHVNLCIEICFREYHINQN